MSRTTAAAGEARSQPADGHTELGPEQLVRLLKEQHVAFCYVDSDLRYRYVNDLFCAMTGMVREELLGHRIRDLLPDVADRVERQLHEVLTTGRSVVGEMIEATSRATGARKSHYQHNYTPFRSASGEIVGVCCVVWSAEHRAKMEEALARARRLESIGRLAAGVAHEINTPAQFLSGNLEFLRESFDAVCRLNEAYARVLDDMTEGRDCAADLASALALKERLDGDFLCAEIPVALEQSLEGIERITHVLQAMRRYSHPGHSSRERVRLHTLIETAIIVARPEWKYVAKIERSFDDTVTEVSCYPQELSQAVLNLLVNAAEAIEASIGDFGPKGTIRVSTKGARDGVEIRVEDSGCGIADAIADRIFDPFFTTKEVGSGTGQGLAIAHRTIVELHGGRLEFDSAVGVGTTFVIRLPGDAGARPGSRERGTAGPG